MTPLVTRYLLLTSLILFSACSQDDEPRSLSPEAANLPSPADIPDAGAFAQHLPSHAFQQFSIATEEAEALTLSIETLTATPTQAALDQARRHWRLSYNAYLAALASSRLPVIEPPEWHSAQLTRRHLTGQLNSWPLEPGYIDYLDGYPLTGIVNDTTLALDAESIARQHRFSDASYVSLGYPAIEFILWGESGERPSSDFNRAAEHTSTPSLIAQDNPAVSNVDPAATQFSSADTPHDHTANPKTASSEPSRVTNQARRGEYLLIISQLLHQQLQRLQLRWEPESGYYANKVTTASPEKILQASLMTAQQLIKEEILGHYLMNEGSSPFSAGNNADVTAILNGMRELFLPLDSQSGLTPLLAQSEHTVDNINADPQPVDETPHTSLSRLSAALAPDAACGTGWQSAESHTASRQACRQQLLSLLAILEEINTQLGMGLNSSH